MPTTYENVRCSGKAGSARMTVKTALTTQADLLSLPLPGACLNNLSSPISEGGRSYLQSSITLRRLKRLMLRSTSKAMISPAGRGEIPSGFSRSDGATVALKDVSFTLQAGEV